jgi:hypothetical protein
MQPSPQTRLQDTFKHTLQGVIQRTPRQRVMKVLDIAELALFIGTLAIPACIVGTLIHSAATNNILWAPFALLAAAFVCVAVDRVVVLRSSANLDISELPSHESEADIQQLGAALNVTVERVVFSKGVTSYWRHTGKRRGVLMLGDDVSQDRTSEGDAWLIPTLSGDDHRTVTTLDSILAHEIGHGAMNHVRLLFFVHVLTPLWALPVILVSTGSAFGVAAASVICTLLAYRTFAWFSQRCELQADAFAASVVTPAVLCATLDSLHHLVDPPTLRSELFGSHPSIARRIQALQQLV